MSAKIILPVAYDGNSVQSNSIVSGEKFTCKKKFTIFSSKPIPAYAKVYMEFTINQHPSDALIRHLPGPADCQGSFFSHPAPQAQPAHFPVRGLWPRGAGGRRVRADG